MSTARKIGKPKRNADGTFPSVYPDPTPEEIAAACLLFQRQWSRGERRKRRFGSGHLNADERNARERVPWQVPVVSTEYLRSIGVDCGEE